MSSHFVDKSKTESFRTGMITSFFEFLDIRTLSLVVGGTMLVSTISMACYLFHRRTYGNFKFWALGMACLSLGFLLFSFRGFLPDMASIVLANGLIFFSFALIYQGFRILKPDTKISGLYLAIMFILPFLIFPYFTYADPSLNVRTSIVSFTGMFHFCLCLKILGTGVRDIRFRENILLGSTLVLAVIALSILGLPLLFHRTCPLILWNRNISGPGPVDHRTGAYCVCHGVDAAEFPVGGKGSGGKGIPS